MTARSLKTPALQRHATKSCLRLPRRVHTGTGSQLACKLELRPHADTQKGGLKPHRLVKHRSCLVPSPLGSLPALGKEKPEGTVPVTHYTAARRRSTNRSLLRADNTTQENDIWRNAWGLGDQAIHEIGSVLDQTAQKRRAKSWRELAGHRRIRHLPPPCYKPGALEQTLGMSAACWARAVPHWGLERLRLQLHRAKCRFIMQIWGLF